MKKIGPKHVIYLGADQIRMAVIAMEDDHVVIKHQETFENMAEPEIIRNFLKKTGTMSKSWIPVVPQSEVLWKELTVPSHEEKEIDGIVRLSMRTAIWDHDDFVFGYHVIEKHADGQAQIRAGVIHRNVLENYWDLLRKAGIRVDRWSVGPVTVIPDPKEQLLDWVPPRIKEDMIRRRWTKTWAEFIVLAAIIIGLAGLFLSMRYFEKTTSLKVLRSHAETLRKRVNEIKDVSAHVKAVKERSANRVFFSDIMERIDQLRDPSVYLNRLEWTGREGLTLQGAAGDEAKVNDFQKQLIASDLFDDVALQYAQRKQQGEDVYFKIRCVWRKKGADL